MNVAFVVNDLQLSGGVGIVVGHARRLSREHGFDVTLALARRQETDYWRYDELEGLHVANVSDLGDRRFDVAVATWWETTFPLFNLVAQRYAFFVQSLEDRFYPPQTADRYTAGLALDLPVAFITEARWIADTLAQLRPAARCYLVRNGIDKEVFAGPDRVTVSPAERPLRVLIEGNPSVWFKGVHSAIEATRRMTEPRHVTVVSGEREYLRDSPVDRVVGPVSHREMAALYADSDVVLKLSAVEGMYGPPLEGFHMGATCVTTEVTGHDEYVEHGTNALVCDWDDMPGTARQLDLLSRDRRLLHELRSNALLTSRGWPSTRQSSQFMALALKTIHRDPPPAPTAGVPQLLADVRAALEAHRGHLHDRDVMARRLARVERVVAIPPVARALALRRRTPFAQLLRLALRVLGR